VTAVERKLEEDLRYSAPRVLAALMRRFGDLSACEDAVQEALLIAASRWPVEGQPHDPVSWLVTVASRRRIDELRAQAARRDREAAYGADATVEWSGQAGMDGSPEQAPATGHDDSLDMLLLCCHPSLTVDSQIALTLRAAAGLGTARIARLLLVPEATVAQRISRAKRAIADAGGRFPAPEDSDRPTRTTAVLHVLYLLFTEGHTASTGENLTDPPLSGEALRLTRLVHQALPDDDEVCGLLALMLLSTARGAARSTRTGALVPLAEQDRRAWDQGLIAAGVALVEKALAAGPLGSYQLQAAIAAVHAGASDAASTDWPQVLALYDLLYRVEPSPVVALNRVVAVAEVHGASAALEVLDGLAADPRLARQHRLHAVRAHLSERVGDLGGAREDYTEAAARSSNETERSYLLEQEARIAARMDQHPTGVGAQRRTS